MKDSFPPASSSSINKAKKFRYLAQFFYVSNVVVIERAIMQTRLKDERHVEMYIEMGWEKAGLHADILIHPWDPYVIDF